MSKFIFGNFVAGECIKVVYVNLVLTYSEQLLNVLLNDNELLSKLLDNFFKLMVADVIN
jgi:hypothetical protein